MPRHRRTVAAPISGEVVATVSERERAWKALNGLGKIIPQLQAFARAVSGNPRLLVRVTADTPHTRDGVVYVRPPLALGDSPTHERNLCGQRDWSGKQMCRACAVREVIDYFLFHEIAHVMNGSDEDLSLEDVRVIGEYCDDWHPPTACHHADWIERNASYARVPIRALDHLNGYLPLIFNVLEDARVNLRMFIQRPGMKDVFFGNIETTMTEGVERITGGDRVKWDSRPPNEQFIIGLFLKASGLELVGKLHPTVIESLNDERIDNLCNEALHAPSAHGTLRITMEVFRVTQDLGYCIVPKCEPKPESEEPIQPTVHPESDGVRVDDAGRDADRPDGSSQLPGGEGIGGDSGGGTAETNHSADEAEGDDGVGDDSEEPDLSDINGWDTGDDEDDPFSDSGIEPASGFEDLAKELSGGSGSYSEATDEDDPVDGSDSDDSESDRRSGGEPGADLVDDFNRRERNSHRQGSDTPSGEAGRTGEQSDSDSSDSSDGEIQDGAGDAVGSDESTEGATGGTVPGGTSSGTGGKGAGNSSAGRGEDAPVDEDDEDEDDEDDEEIDYSTPRGSADAWSVPGALPPESSERDAAKALAPFLMHNMGNEEDGSFLDTLAGEDADDLLDGMDHGHSLNEDTVRLIRIAMAQAEHFDELSEGVNTVEVATFPSRRLGWSGGVNWRDYAAAEGIMGSAVLHARRAFEVNKRSEYKRNLKTGKVDTRVLGSRAPFNDPRMMMKMVIPGKRDHFVVIGADRSGSTAEYGRWGKINRAVLAQCELLSRVGVAFEGFGHTGDNKPMSRHGYGKPDDMDYLYVLPFKLANQPWNDAARERLVTQRPLGFNLDGHQLQYYRKRAQLSTAQVKTIVYYNDGQMPARNYYEERKVLLSEQEICEAEGIHVIMVGINTDSPKEYGFDTVRMDGDEDILKVVAKLQERLVLSK